jgi:holo-[acyl-carrier protein] synthase
MSAKPAPRGILGIGTDIIECVRIAQMIEKHGELFLTRVFTQREIAYCSSRRAANQHYAGRWAAKEAALKALGTGWAKGIKWTDIEVFNQVGGRPILILSNRALEVSQEIGIAEMLISISHCRNYAVAYVSAVG